MIYNMDLENRKQLLAEIASLYYVEKKTQAEIAKIFGYSRSAISRLLSEAEEIGIIEFSIKYPMLQDRELEGQLKESYGLKAVFVVDSGISEYAHVLEKVGRLGARYVQQLIKEDMTIGVGWGSSLFELVNALPQISFSNIKIVQVIGATGGRSDQRVDGPDLAMMLAEKLNATHQYLHTPAYLSNISAAQTIRDQKQIQETLEAGYQSDIVLLGVGTIEVDPLYSSIFRTGYLNEMEVMEIRRDGGVCNFCGVVLDEDGKLLDIEINKRVVATDIQRLQENKCFMIGIAAGEQKANAIKAVLNGKWLDVLITDSIAAKAVL